MRSALALAFLLSSATSAEPIHEGWTAFRGPRGTGQAASGLPAGEGPLGFAVRWSRELGSGYSGLAVAGDLVVTAARAGDEDVLLALSAADGSERWRVSLGPAYAGHDGSHDGPIATPAIAGGQVFALGARGRLVAVEASSGRVHWQRELETELGAKGPYYGWASSPRVVEGLVVLWAGGEVGFVAAFDVADGSLRWRQLEESTDAQSPMVATLGGKQQVVVIGGTSVAGLEPRDGTVLWRLEHGGGPSPMGAPTSSPLVLDDHRVFFKHGADSTMVLRVEQRDGAWSATIEREVRALARSYSPPALVGEVLYGYSGRFLGAVDASSGELLWRSREPGDGFLVAVEDQLVVLTKEGDLHLAPAARDGWREAARLDLFEALAWTPPAVDGSSVYARSLGGVARVDLVRAAAPQLAAPVELPAVLAPLAAELESAADPAAAVSRFLAGRQLPIVDGEEVVFVWRGRGADLAIAGDMIGMRREEPMHRLGKSDLWWWSTRLDRRARVSYVFLVDNEPAVDPAHPRRVAATVLGPDLNWQRGQGLQMSWLAMPEWPGRALPESPARGRIERFEVAVPKPAAADAAAGETVAVPLTVWLPPASASLGPLPVVYVHDRHAFEHGRWAETLDRVVGRTVQPLVAVFLERPRGVDLTTAFREQIVPAVERRYRVRSDRDGRANVGMGWSSHEALMQTLRAPGTFGALAMQSYYGLEEMMQEVTPLLAAADPAEQPLRIYLEWGRWDLVSRFEGMNMRASSEWLAAELARRGYRARGGEVADATDFASWRNRTDLVLESLYPLPGVTTEDLPAWQLPAEAGGKDQPAGEVAAAGNQGR
jgi:outer membrane protein assembly factor BamB